MSGEIPMEIKCSFCDKPSTVQCIWIFANRKQCQSVMCNDCTKHREMNICVNHPHASWVQHEVVEMIDYKSITFKCSNYK